MAWFAKYIEPLQAIVAATLGLDGTLLEANAGFLRLMPTGGSSAIGMPAAHVFIQPEFSAFVSATPEAGGDVYRGLLTLGEYQGKTRSLRGRLWRAGSEVRVLAEYDVEDLERLYDTALDLNRGYADAQSVMTQTNLTLQHREAQSAEASVTDPLTNVGNRRRLEQVLPVETSRSERTGDPLSAIMADLDHFKSVNDTYGHDAGDAVLVAFAALLRQQTRPTDIVVRLGGEEFMVLMPHTDLARALGTAGRIRRALEATSINPLPRPVTGSFGVAQLGASEHGEALLQRADKALYAAKESGRNRVVAG